MKNTIFLAFCMAINFMTFSQDKPGIILVTKVDPSTFTYGNSYGSNAGAGPGIPWNDLTDEQKREIKERGELNSARTRIDNAVKFINENYVPLAQAKANEWETLSKSPKTQKEKDYLNASLVCLSAFQDYIHNSFTHESNPETAEKVLKRRSADRLEAAEDFLQKAQNLDELKRNESKFIDAASSKTYEDIKLLDKEIAQVRKIRDDLHKEFNHSKLDKTYLTGVVANTVAKFAEILEIPITHALSLTPGGKQKIIIKESLESFIGKLLEETMAKNQRFSPEILSKCFDKVAADYLLGKYYPKTKTVQDVLSKNDNFVKMTMSDLEIRHFLSDQEKVLIDMEANYNNKIKLICSQNKSKVKEGCKFFFNSKMSPIEKAKLIMP